LGKGALGEREKLCEGFIFLQFSTGQASLQKPPVFSFHVYSFGSKKTKRQDGTDDNVVGLFVRLPFLVIFSSYLFLAFLRMGRPRSCPALALDDPSQ
jgi:hypothetical protein